jgi:hypothetical protein
MRDLIREEVTSVAVLIGEANRFAEQAGAAAERLGPAALPHFPEALGDVPAAPAGFAAGGRSRAAWVWAWLSAAFEVLYRMGAAALPVVREEAFGEYDWRQALALEALCRFAADGLERWPIVEGLSRELPHLHPEALRHAAEALEGLAREEPPLMSVWYDEPVRREYLRSPEGRHWPPRFERPPPWARRDRLSQPRPDTPAAGPDVDIPF